MSTGDREELRRCAWRVIDACGRDGLLVAAAGSPLYPHVWTRDVGVAALGMLAAARGEDDAAAVARSLAALARHQDRLGRLPLKIDPRADCAVKENSAGAYQTLDDLLADDPREEMQNLRLNLQASIRRLDLLGNRLELQATTISGEPLSTDDLAGSFVIVDFFATWCEPCLAEIPRLRAHYEKYHSRGLEIVGISLDADRKDLDAFLAKADLPWPIIHDNADDVHQRLQMKFGVSVLPTVMLLNKEGTVVSLEAHGEELERLMQMLFARPTEASAEPPIESDAEEQ